MKNFIKYKTYLKTRSVQHINARILNLKRPKFKRLKKAVARKYRISKFYRSKLIRIKPILYRQETQGSTPFKVDEWVRSRYYKPVQQFFHSLLKNQKRNVKASIAKNINRRLKHLDLVIKHAGKMRLKSFKSVNKIMLTENKNFSLDLVNPLTADLPIAVEDKLLSKNRVVSDNPEQVISSVKDQTSNPKSPVKKKKKEDGSKNPQERVQPKDRSDKKPKERSSDRKDRKEKLPKKDPKGPKVPKDPKKDSKPLKDSEISKKTPSKGLQVPKIREQPEDTDIVKRSKKSKTVKKSKEPKVPKISEAPKQSKGSKGVKTKKNTSVPNNDSGSERRG